MYPNETPNALGADVIVEKVDITIIHMRTYIFILKKNKLLPTCYYHIFPFLGLIDVDITHIALPIIA